jgi:uncharacterized coiled-coil protein SlyX
MPDNHTPATQPDPDATPGEFNFDKPLAQNPRIKRRSLKAQSGGSLTPASGAPPAARELEREAPPLSVEDVVKPRTEESGEQPPIKPTAKVVEPAHAPPKVTPATAAMPAASSTSGIASTPKIASTVNPTTSPHGTRPATLYYSSRPRKDKEATLPMKTIPTASTTSSSTGTTLPSAARPATASSQRPATTVDYRANVERQTREQKSVGSLLAYVVYGLIAFFVISAGLAAYGANVIFKQLHDENVTVTDLDAHYSAATKDLNVKLGATQDTLGQAQAQIARQQDLIVKQQEELNRVIAALNDETNALKVERQARAQETASLRARVKDLENRPAYQQKY